MAGGATCASFARCKGLAAKESAYITRQAFPGVLSGSMAGGVLHIKLEQSREGGEIELMGKGCDGKQGRRYLAGVTYFGVSLCF